MDCVRMCYLKWEQILCKIIQKNIQIIFTISSIYFISLTLKRFELVMQSLVEINEFYHGWQNKIRLFHGVMFTHVNIKDETFNYNVRKSLFINDLIILSKF